MEETSTNEMARAHGIGKDTDANSRRPPRDVRDWLKRVEAIGELKRIDAPVDLDQELSAVACMAAQREVAGGLLGEGVQLTKGVEVNLPIPAHAEIVVEGYLHPGEREMEGPLGNAA